VNLITVDPFVAILYVIVIVLFVLACILVNYFLLPFSIFLKTGPAEPGTGRVSSSSQ